MPSRPVVLATFNARWSHSSLALRCLAANLGELRARAVILELDLDQRPAEVAERILELDPVLVGLGVYVWNVRQSTELARLLKTLRPRLPLVLGGPEVSFELDDLPVARVADWVIQGEAEAAFRDLCGAVAAGRPPMPGVIDAAPPDLGALELPYELYDDLDLAQRAVYLEASRGCPYGCEFCLASLSPRVRRVPPDELLAALDRLWRRGLRRYRFVDRSLHLAFGAKLLRFFLDRSGDGLFLHLELVPDRLPTRLRPLLAAFPAGSLQLEVGIQTFDESVAGRVGRRQDPHRVEGTLRFLREGTAAHLHTDLLVGLPGQGLSVLAADFDRLVALGPHEVQVGLLKRLRGAPLARRAGDWGLLFSPDPPYEVVETPELDFATLQRLRRLSRVVDLVVNSGRFTATAPLLWHGGSPFAGLLALADWLQHREGRVHAIALPRLTRLLFEHLTGPGGRDASQVAAALEADARRLGQEPVPLEVAATSGGRETQAVLPPRQRRHRGVEPADS